jgi:hypothetical protein
VRERLGRRDRSGWWLGRAQARDKVFGLFADVGEVLRSY